MIQADGQHTWTCKWWSSGNHDADIACDDFSDCTEYSPCAVFFVCMQMAAPEAKASLGPSANTPKKQFPLLQPRLTMPTVWSMFFFYQVSKKMLCVDCFYVSLHKSVEQWLYDKKANLEVVCVYLCMNVCLYVCMNAGSWLCVCMYVCMHVYIDLCMYLSASVKCTSIPPQQSWKGHCVYFWLRLSGSSELQYVTTTQMAVCTITWLSTCQVMTAWSMYMCAHMYTCKPGHWWHGICIWCRKELS